ncbi:MAG: hypothetical protein U0L25_04085 [Ligilactobacillus ruminis]|nr:hypothetical protein [Ligilactobacillus ruminis]
MKIAIFILVFAYAYPLLYGNKQKILFSCIKNEKFRTNSIDLRLPLFGISFKLGHAIKPFSTIMESRFGMEALGSIARLNDLQLKIQKTVPNVPHEPEKIYDQWRNTCSECGHISEFSSLSKRSSHISSLEV